MKGNTASPPEYKKRLQHNRRRAKNAYDINTQHIGEGLGDLGGGFRERIEPIGAAS